MIKYTWEFVVEIYLMIENGKDKLPVYSDGRGRDILNSL